MPPTSIAEISTRSRRVGRPRRCPGWASRPNAPSPRCRHGCLGTAPPVARRPPAQRLPPTTTPGCGRLVGNSTAVALPMKGSEKRKRSDIALESTCDPRRPGPAAQISGFAGSGSGVGCAVGHDHPRRAAQQGLVERVATWRPMTTRSQSCSCSSCTINIHGSALRRVLRRTFRVQPASTPGKARADMLCASRRAVSQ